MIFLQFFVIDHRVKSVKDTWTVSEKDKVPFIEMFIVLIFRNSAVRVKYICVLQFIKLLNNNNLKNVYLFWQGHLLFKTY